MSFLFDWIYKGFSSILQFLGEYCVLLWNDVPHSKYSHPKLGAFCSGTDMLL